LVSTSDVVVAWFSFAFHFAVKVPLIVLTLSNHGRKISITGDIVFYVYAISTLRLKSVVTVLSIKTASTVARITSKCIGATSSVLAYIVDSTFVHILVTVLSRETATTLARITSVCVGATSSVFAWILDGAFVHIPARPAVV